MATMNAFKDGARNGVGHVWGIPFATDVQLLDRSGSTSSGPLQKAFFSSITSNFGYSLTWSLLSWGPQERRTRRRRAGFPTWSWTACTAAIDFMQLPWGTQAYPI